MHRLALRLFRTRLNALASVGFTEVKPVIIEQVRYFGGRRHLPPFPFMATTIKHFLQFSDFTLEEFEYVIERARVIKHKFKSYEQYHPLLDRTLVMVFEKNSTRTRLSFEAGMH